MLPVAVAAQSSYDGIAMCHVLPVLWIASFFPTTGPMAVWCCSVMLADDCPTFCSFGCGNSTCEKLEQLCRPSFTGQTMCWPRQINGSFQLTCYSERRRYGDAENAGTEHPRPENAGPNVWAGKCGTGKWRTTAIIHEMLFPSCVCNVVY